MIEVTITNQQLLAEIDKYEWSLGCPLAVKLACAARALLHAAGIPLEMSFDPACEPRVRSGRLEWYEDRFRDVKVFRWHPPTEAVAPPP